ncbi:MAG: bis(5'-nucleosyl)-tetraphosphatase (symmetrical) YqeK [Candidatus Hydrogenedentales bacterium]
MTTMFEIPRAGEFVALLHDRLPDKTYQHCLSVAEFCRSFIHKAGITEEQAITAGLLHDLCKPLKNDEMLIAAAKYDIRAAPLQREKPTLLHGPVAAEECRRELGVVDPDILDAIYWHTTGRADWNPVGVALYVADYAEPRRQRRESDEARAILEKRGYEAAVRYVVNEKISQIEKKWGLDPDALAFREWIERAWRPPA